MQVKQIKPADNEVLEEWVRVTDDEDIKGASAFRVPDQTWRVSVTVAEFIRSEPLESELRTAMTHALLGVNGVTQAVQEDREVWIVVGTVRGDQLVRASAAVLDQFAPRTRKALNDLEQGAQ